MRRTGRDRTPPLGVRGVVLLLVALQFLVPAVLLAVRLANPDVGTLDLGWQMHTSCWSAPCP